MLEGVGADVWVPGCQQQQVIGVFVYVWEILEERGKGGLLTAVPCAT